MTPSTPEEPRPVLTVPPGLLGASDPFRRALLGRLEVLSGTLARPGHPGAPWALRDALDLATFFLASAAVAPLSAGDAPLPGWRRGLWRSDFADLAPGLLSWAAACLPRRSRQSQLARTLLELLFEDGSRHTATVPRPFADLVGLRDPARAGLGGWQDWRERFFSQGDPARLGEAGQGLGSFLEGLQALLLALEAFLAAWTPGTVPRGETLRLALRSEEESHELPPLLVLQDCEGCGSAASLFLLVAPTAGERYLFREIGSGHLASVPVDPGFQRRFFLGGPPAERARVAPPAVLQRLPAQPSEAGTSEAALAEVLSPEVLARHHLPLLLALCALGEPAPPELLLDPALGCREGAVAAARMAGLLARTPEGGVEPASPELAAELREAHPEEAREACRRLALWAEARMLEPGGAGAAGGLAGRGLARWALAAGWRGRGVDPRVGEEFLRWLDQEEREGRGDRTLRGTEDWTALLEGAPGESLLLLARLRALRGTRFVRSRALPEALKELDWALELPSEGREGQRFQARVLEARARVHLDLARPGPAGDDAGRALDLWTRLAASSAEDAEVAAGLAEAVRLRGRALVAQGQSRQAAAWMQKASEGLSAPRDPEALRSWIGLQVDLGELLQGLGDLSSSQVRFRAALEHLEASPDPGLAVDGARALRGRAAGLEAAEARLDLARARSLLDERAARDGAGVGPLLADVLAELAARNEQAGFFEEALEAATDASDLLAALVSDHGRADLRVSWARALRQWGRLALAAGHPGEAEAALTGAAGLFAELVGSGQAHLDSEWSEALAARGILRAGRECWEDALEDLDAALRRWPDPAETGAPATELVRALRERARLHRRRGRAEEAARDHDRALELFRGDPGERLELRMERAMALLAAGLPGRAEEDLEAILEGQGSASLRFRVHLARGVARLRQEAWQGAAEDFEAAEAGEPLPALAGRGLAQLHLASPEMAVQCFRSLLERAEEAPPGENRSERTLAHGGLALLLEHVGAEDQAWTEWRLAARAWTAAGDPAGLLAWEVGEMLDRAGRVHRDRGYLEEALGAFLAARDLQAEPAVRGEAAELARLRVRGAAARALVALGREREAVAEARAATSVSGEVALREPELAAELHLFCGRTLLVAGARGAATRAHLDGAVTLLEGLEGSPARLDLVQARVLRGIARAVARDRAGAESDLGRVLELLEDPSCQSGAWAWEKSLALLRRARVRVARGDDDAALPDLEAALELLPDLDAPPAGLEWLREETLAALVGFPLPSSAPVAGALGRLATLPGWSPAERRDLEEAWSEALGRASSMRLFAALPPLAVALGESAGGKDLLAAWMDRGLELAARVDGAAEAALGTLADLLASTTLPRDRSLRSRARQGQAGAWERQGDPRRALELLDQALGELEDDEAERPGREASIRADRARLLARVGDEEAARQQVEELLGGPLGAVLAEPQRRDLEELRSALVVRPPWSAEPALEQVDRALEALDRDELEEAERLLLEASHDLPRPGSEAVLPLFPALLEGLVGLAEALQGRDWALRALAIAEYGANLGRDYLAAAFDPDSWPWWGDLQFLAGRLQQQTGRLQRACESFRGAREAWLALVVQGGLEEARQDVFQARVARAAVLQDLGALEEAEREYAEALRDGRAALAAGLPVGSSLVRVYLGRGRLALEAGRPEEALPEYEGVLDLLESLPEAEHGGDRLVEGGAARVGLVEALARLGRWEEGEGWRAQAAEIVETLRRQGRPEPAADLEDLLGRLEALRPPS